MNVTLDINIKVTPISLSVSEENKAGFTKILQVDNNENVECKEL